MNEKSPILLIDDDEDDRFIFNEGFVHAGCGRELVLKESGMAAFGWLDQLEPNGLPIAILLDLNMPVMDGREILQRLKGSSTYRHIPVIVFTTSTHVRDRNAAYELGANCFISKPGSYGEVLEMTKSITILWCGC